MSYLGISLFISTFSPYRTAKHIEAEGAGPQVAPPPLGFMLRLLWTGEGARAPPSLYETADGGFI